MGALADYCAAIGLEELRKCTRYSIIFAGVSTGIQTEHLLNGRQ
jgi:hypothetical protein